jgi:hypothetical protein
MRRTGLGEHASKGTLTAENAKNAEEPEGKTISLDFLSDLGVLGGK